MGCTKIRFALTLLLFSLKIIQFAEPYTGSLPNRPVKFSNELPKRILSRLTTIGRHQEMKPSLRQVKKKKKRMQKRAPISS